MIPTPRPSRKCLAVLLFGAALVDITVDARAAVEANLIRPPVEKTRRTQWALLVAIDEYPEARILRSEGAVAASKSIAAVLVRRYGFARSRISELYGQEATSSRINEELRRLGSQMSPADSLFVLLSIASIDLAKEPTVFLVPHDVKLDAPWTLIPVPQLAASLIDLPADPVLAIFDGCASRWEFALRQMRGYDIRQQSSSKVQTSNPPLRSVANREFLSTCTGTTLTSRESLATLVLRWLQAPAAPGERRRGLELQKTLVGPSRSVDVTSYGRGPGFGFESEGRDSDDLAVATDRQRAIDERGVAIERLSRLGSKITDPDAAAAALRQIADSESEPVPLRQRAALALGQISIPASADALARLAMEDPSPELSLTAVRALAGLSPGLAIPALESVLTGGPPHVKRAALRTLVAFNATGSVPKIAVLLRDSSDSQVRLACLDAIQALGADSAAAQPTLMALARDESDPEVSAAALRVLSLNKAEGRSDLFRNRLSDAKSPIVRRAAAYALGGILPSDPAVADLIRATSDDDPGVREAAVFVLGKARAAAAYDPLVKALHDTAAAVRTAAVDALGKLGNRAAIPQLMDVLRAENPEARRAGTAALGRLGAVQSFSDLVRLATTDPSSVVRTEANAALEAVLKETNFKDALAEPALSDESGEIQVAAINWLARTKDSVWLPKFKTALSSRDEKVRDAAFAGIVAVGSDRAVEILAEELTHAEGLRRDQAVRAFTGVRSPKALETLLYLVEPSTADPVLIEALGGYADARAIKSAKRFTVAGDSRQRLAAANALQRQALALHEKGETKDGLALAETAFDIRKQIYGEDRLEVAVDLNNLGVMYLALGQLDFAQFRLTKALEIRRNSGSPDAAVATTLSNLGAIAVRRGDHKDALDRFLQALHIREYALGTDSPETLSTLNSIADVYDAIGDRKRAAEYRKQAESRKAPPEAPAPPTAD